MVREPVADATTDVLRTRSQDGVLTLTLNRPEKRNALSADLIGRLSAALETADLDGDVRVVVLRGEGRDFCAGADLAELLASAGRDAGENEADALRLGDGGGQSSGEDESDGPWSRFHVGVLLREVRVEDREG